MHLTKTRPESPFWSEQPFVDILAAVKLPSLRHHSKHLTLRVHWGRMALLLGLFSRAAARLERDACGAT